MRRGLRGMPGADVEALSLPSKGAPVTRGSSEYLEYLLVRPASGLEVLLVPRRLNDTVVFRHPACRQDRVLQVSVEAASHLRGDRES